MKNILARTALAAALLCSTAGAVTMLSASPAYAEEHVSKAVGKPLNDAIKAAQAKDWAGANAAVAEAEAGASTDFDKLKINQIKAYIAVSQKDYAAATTLYELIIVSPAFGSLDPKDQQEGLRNALLLATNAQHWPQVIAAAERLQKLAPLDALALSNLAVAYYNTKDLDKAKETAQKSIDMDKAAGKQPEQAALQIMMSAQASNNDQAGALATLEQLAIDYGNPADWNKVIETAFSTPGITELDALYMYRLMFQIGANPEADDYTSAAGIADHAGYPAEAMAILNAGLSAGKISRGGRVSELLGKAGPGEAQDRKLLPQLVKLADAAKDGKQELALAEDYWGYGRYADAVTAGQAALTKGGLKDPGEAHFIIGICLVAQGQYAQGIDALSNAGAAPARAKAAHLWTIWAQRKMKAAPAAH